MNAPIIIGLVLMIGFAVAIPWALRMDRADFHLAHTTDCPDCEES